jgi:RNA-directed DNA polymerase
MNATTEEADEGAVWSPTNRRGLPLKVHELQGKLYRKAKEEPGFRFYSVFGLILRRDVLMTGWDLVSANNGGPGVDGVTIAMIAARPGGASSLIDEIESELRTRTYRPSAVKRKMIPKANGKLRPLGIPTVKDRVVQTAVKLVLEPIFEADFLECSHGFRLERSAHDAIAEVKRNLRDGRTAIYDADLSSYFDTIPHDKLMLCVERRIVDRSVLALIRLWLTCEVEERDEDGGPPRRSRPSAGTPQGGVISPLLANLYLHWFDKLFHGPTGPREWANARLVRYADDLVIQARFVGDRLLDWIEETVEGRFKLTINRAKTVVRRVSPDRADGVDFLGYRFWHAPDRFGRDTRYLTTNPSPKAMAAERENLRAILNHRSNFVPIPLLIDRVNRQLTGWSAYHRKGRPANCFRQINGFVVERLRRHLKRRSQRPYLLPEGTTWWQHLTQDLGLQLLALTPATANR